MTIPKNDCLTLASVAKELDKHVDDIEEYLVNGDLTASIRHLEGLELFEVDIEYNDDIEDFESIHKDKSPSPAEDGLYSIINYSKIRWDYNSSIHQNTANLTNLNVYLRKNHRDYAVAFGYVLKKDDVFVTSQEINRFKSPFDPSEFMNKELKNGKTKNDIIIELIEIHRVTYHKLACILSLDSNDLEHDSVKKRGQRAYITAKKPIKNNKKKVSRLNKSP